MLTLLLLRHAKAEIGSASMPDAERPLAPRGRTDAPRIGAFLASQGLVPDLVLCSTARRTRETWGLVASQFNGPVPCHMEPAIYEATTARLKTLVRKTLPGTTRLMIVGHNPGLEELTHELILDGDTIALERFETKFPTGSLAVLTWPHDNWAKVTGRTAYLAHFTAPRYLT